MVNRRTSFDISGNDLSQVTRLVAIGVGVLALLLVGFRCVYTVEPNEQAVVMRFGSYQKTSEPGLNFCIPFVDRILTAKMEERTLRLPIGVQDERSRGRRTSDEESLMLTGDLNAAEVQWTIQWQVSDPKQYLFAFYDTNRDQDEFLQEVISVVARTVMNRMIGDYSFDEVLTGKRSEIGDAAQLATQAILDKYECGIRINDLDMQRVTPPSQVKASYAAVQEAVQMRDKYINEANKERNELMPRARAESDKSVREAEGYAARRRAEASGEIDALMAQYREYAKAPEETRQRMYLESMEKVLSSIDDKLIIDSDLKQLLPLLQLNGGSN
jgi:modulator of FtsH protease HflK